MFSRKIYNMLIACSTGNSQLPLGQKTQKGGWVGSVSSRECLDAPAIPATLKVARIAGASRHSRLETEPRVGEASLTFRDRVPIDPSHAHDYFWFI